MTDEPDDPQMELDKKSPPSTPDWPAIGQLAKVIAAFLVLFLLVQTCFLGVVAISLRNVRDTPSQSTASSNYKSEQVTKVIADAFDPTRGGDFVVLPDPKLPKDVFVRLTLSDTSPPIDIHKREVATVLKWLLRATREPAGDRFLVQEVHDSGRSVALLLDRQTGRVWKLARDEFRDLPIHNRPTVTDVNSPGGEVIDLMIDRLAGHTLMPKAIALKAGLAPRVRR